jgi:hypothetical protein
MIRYACARETPRISATSSGVSSLRFDTSGRAFGRAAPPLTAAEGDETSARRLSRIAPSSSRSVASAAWIDSRSSTMRALASSWWLGGFMTLAPRARRAERAAVPGAHVR